MSKARTRGGNTDGDDRAPRSGESRFIFQCAGRRTIKADADHLTLAHLLEEIIEHMPVIARPFFKSAPASTPKDVDEWPDYIVDDARH